jgi:hypothetical protein
MYEYELFDTSTGTFGETFERVQQMQDKANDMADLGWRWVRTDGPVMVFERVPGERLGNGTSKVLPAGE